MIRDWLGVENLWAKLKGEIVWVHVGLAPQGAARWDSAPYRVNTKPVESWSLIVKSHVFHHCWVGY